MLSRLSVSDEEWARYVADRVSRRKSATPPPQFLTVDGTSPEKKEAIASRLSSFLDKPIDQPSLNRVDSVVWLGLLFAAELLVYSEGPGDRASHPC